MRFTQPLRRAVLERRYKRFLADVELADGRRITAHCPNTGSMMGCATPGSAVWLSVSDSPRRKYAHTWELVEVAGGVTVGIHTGRTNALVAEALDRGLLPELDGYRARRAEVPVPDERMRADFLLSDGPNPDCYLEVKNVTAAVSHGVALFPDAVSERASRHLAALAGCVRRGLRAALVFLAQRSDVSEVRPADEIDPEYGRRLREVAALGVEVYAARASVSPEAITPDQVVPVNF